MPNTETEIFSLSSCPLISQATVSYLFLKPSLALISEKNIFKNCINMTFSAFAIKLAG